MTGYELRYVNSGESHLQWQYLWYRDYAKEYRQWCARTTLVLFTIELYESKFRMVTQMGLIPTVMKCIIRSGTSPQQTPSFFHYLNEGWSIISNTIKNISWQFCNILEPLLLTWIYYNLNMDKWFSNYIHYKVWDEIRYPFLNATPHKTCLMWCC